MVISAAFFSGLLKARPSDAVARKGPYALLKKELNRTIRNRPGARQLGGLYLAAYPEEKNLDRLAGDLLAGVREGDPGALRRRIQDLRMRDFAREDTVIIGGWVLARVEARVCALIRLL